MSSVSQPVPREQRITGVQIQHEVDEKTKALTLTAKVQVNGEWRSLTHLCKLNNYEGMGLSIDQIKDVYSECVLALACQEFTQPSGPNEAHKHIEDLMRNFNTKLTASANNCQQATLQKMPKQAQNKTRTTEQDAKQVAQHNNLSAVQQSHAPITAPSMPGSGLKPLDNLVELMTSPYERVRTDTRADLIKSLFQPSKPNLTIWGRFQQPPPNFADHIRNNQGNLQGIMKLGNELCNHPNVTDDGKIIGLLVQAQAAKTVKDAIGFLKQIAEIAQKYQGKNSETMDSATKEAILSAADYGVKLLRQTNINPPLKPGQKAEIYNAVIDCAKAKKWTFFGNGAQTGRGKHYEMQAKYAIKNDPQVESILRGDRQIADCIRDYQKQEDPQSGLAKHYFSELQKFSAGERQVKPGETIAYDCSDKGKKLLKDFFDKKSALSSAPQVTVAAPTRRSSSATPTPPSTPLSSPRQSVSASSTTSAITAAQVAQQLDSIKERIDAAKGTLSVAEGALIRNELNQLSQMSNNLKEKKSLIEQINVQLSRLPGEPAE